MQSQPLSKVINNYLTFQLAWVACAYWHDYRSTLVCLACLFWLYLAEPWSRLRFTQTIQLAALGIVVDSMLTLGGVLEFTDPLAHLPIWLYSLWLVFASSLTMSLYPLLKHPRLAAGVGAIFGPLAYWAGAQLDALSLNLNWINGACLVLVWGCYFVGAAYLVKQKSQTQLQLEINK